MTIESMTSRELDRLKNRLVPWIKEPYYRDEKWEPRYVDHRQPTWLFGKQYAWTLFDKDWNMTDVLHLVPYEAYHDVIQRNLRLATLQGHI